MGELVSVIIISYNTEKYINKCIESVINQTYKNIDIVIVNDGSTDNTASIIQEYVKKDSRINFINRNQNKGTMYTRVEGFKNAKADYVCFVDSDDWIEENAIEFLYKKIKENNVDLVKGNLKIYDNGKIKQGNREVKKEIILKKEDFNPYVYDLLYNTTFCNSMCGQLIKKEYLSDIINIDSSKIYGEDLQSNLFIYKKINSVMFINNELYIYRANQGSITSTLNEDKLNKKLVDAIDTYYNLYYYLDDEKYKKLAQDKMIMYVTMILIDFAKIKNLSKFIELIGSIAENKQVQEVLSNYNSKIQISTDRFIKTGMNLFMKKHYKTLYRYFKYIYTPVKRIYKVIHF